MSRLVRPPAAKLDAEYTKGVTMSVWHITILQLVITGMVPKYYEERQMDGVRVGKRLIGTQAPVTIGWENIGRVEGGPVKQFVFTWFQPTVLFAPIAFWYYAPNSIAKASTAIGIGIGFRALLLAMEWFFPRYESWRLTWKEFATDLFYVGLGYTILRLVDNYIGDGVMIEAIQGLFH